MDIINSVPVSDWIQIAAIISSLFVGVVGIYYSHKAVKLQAQATEDLAKPYVNVYIDVFAIKNQQRVFVFKNFGQTPAYIDSIQVEGQLDQFNKYHFQSLIGNMIAPGQKFTSNIENEYKNTVKITIKYHDIHSKGYEDTFALDSQIAENFACTLNESNKNDQTPSAIRQSTMALIRELR